MADIVSIQQQGMNAAFEEQDVQGVRDRAFPTTAEPGEPHDAAAVSHEVVRDSIVPQRDRAKRHGDSGWSCGFLASAAYTSRNNRVGSSQISLIVFRKLTASRPSIMR